MPTPITLEICVDSPRSAEGAVRGGAHRIELCCALAEGGLTPSAGLIATVRAHVELDLYVMIRPRPGDFCYDPGEFAAMKHDIATAKELRANGVVFGILREEGSIDGPRCRELLDLARPLGTTFHRAFDMSRDLSKSLEEVIALGFDRVLTSGGEQKVQNAVTMVKLLREQAGDRIAVMIGSGINSANAAELMTQTGVREIHASARRIEPGPMLYRNKKIAMGGQAGREYEQAVADEEEVRKLVRAIVTAGV
jgi:copper homeostasis protein